MHSHIIMQLPAKAATSPKPKKVTSLEKKAIRKKKDPKATKRALSAYMLWLSENRAKLANPGMIFADVLRAAGAQWAKVADKLKWEKLAAKEKKRCEKEMAAFKGVAPKLMRKCVMATPAMKNGRT
ncbi:HMG box [Ancylostoma ceylanicum]|uniref:HMG box n=1 Tax=Ancylostoma ceylanicum TaxID=53326 RepID=A0A0D6LHW8_9BILA|nr:HMG box [Ancylostoma ceylanicum]